MKRLIEKPYEPWRDVLWVHHRILDRVHYEGEPAGGIAETSAVVSEGWRGRHRVAAESPKAPLMMLSDSQTLWEFDWHYCTAGVWAREVDKTSYVYRSGAKPNTRRGPLK